MLTQGVCGGGVGLSGVSKIVNREGGGIVRVGL